MATLTGTTIADTYDSLLHVEDNTAGLVATSTDSRVIQDGVGVASAFALATDSVRITGTNKLYFNDVGGEYISGNASILSIVGGSEIDLTATAIDINGAVDISGTLELNDDISILQGKKILFDTASADTYIYADTANPENLYIAADDDIILQPDDDLVIQASTTEYVRFDGANQRVGIGTDVPSTQLHVRKDVASAEFIALNLQNYQTEDDTSASVTLQFSADASQINCAKITVGKDSSFSSGANSDSFMNFSTILNNGTTSVMRLTSAGYVGIGVTDPDSPLEVVATLTGTSHVVHVHNASTADTADCLYLSNAHASHPTTTNNYISFNDADATIDEMEGDGAGGVRFTGTAQATYSDSRIKINIADLSSGLDKINALTPKTFDFTDEFKAGSFQSHAIKDWQKKSQVGFIAQEFKIVFPDLVQTDKRAVNVDSVTYDGKDYSKDEWVEIESLEKRSWQFEAYLVKAIQELSASNDALKARIEVLEAA